MKLFAFVFIITFILGVRAYTEEELAGFKEECISSSGINRDLIQRAEIGDFDEENNLNCYSHCLFKKMKFMDEDGNVNLDEMKSTIADHPNKEKLEKILEVCQKTGGSACETAYLSYRCYWEEISKNK